MIGITSGVSQRERKENSKKKQQIQQLNKTKQGHNSEMLNISLEIALHKLRSLELAFAYSCSLPYKMHHCSSQKQGCCLKNSLACSQQIGAGVLFQRPSNSEKSNSNWLWVSKGSSDYKQLLDEVFVISRIIKVEEGVISLEADNTYWDLDYSWYHKNRI